MKAPTDLHPDDRAARVAICEELIALRRRAGLSQEQAGARIGMAQAQLSWHEQRTNNATIAVFQARARGLGRRLDLRVPGADVPPEWMRPDDPAAADTWDQEVLTASLITARHGLRVMQRVMAERIGVSNQAISRIETTPAGVLMLATAQRYCRVLGLPLGIALVELELSEVPA